MKNAILSSRENWKKRTRLVKMKFFHPAVHARVTDAMEIWIWRRVSSDADWVRVVSKLSAKKYVYCLPFDKMFTIYSMKLPTTWPIHSFASVPGAISKTTRCAVRFPFHLRLISVIDWILYCLQPRRRHSKCALSASGTSTTGRTRRCAATSAARRASWRRGRSTASHTLLSDVKMRDIWAQW